MKINFNLINTSAIRINFFSLLMIFLFALYLIDLILYPNGRQLDNYFLRMGDFLADLQNHIGYTLGSENLYFENKNGLQESCYPPLAYMIFNIVGRLITFGEDYLSFYKQKVFLHTFFIVIYSFMILYFLAISNLSRNRSRFERGFLSLSLLVSWPILFTIERGNIIILASLLVAIYIGNYDNKHSLLRELSIICLAIAFALKITPAIFGILLVYNKNYKGVLRLIIYSLILFFSPFLYFSGNFYDTICQFYKNIGAFTHAYSEFGGVGFMSTVRFFATHLGLREMTEEGSIIVLLLHIMKYVISLLFLLSGFFVREKWKLVGFTTLVFITLPHVSQDYVLCYFLPFIVLFMTDSKESIVLTIIVTYAFFTLLSPYKTQYYFLLDFHFGVILIYIINFFIIIKTINQLVKEKLSY